MIRALRNSGIGQLFLGAIVVAIILAFVLTGAAPSPGGTDGECVAEVGKDICIEPKEFDAAYRLLSAIGGGNINEAAAARLRLREQVARGLVERELLVKEAKRLKIGTSQDDVDAELLEGRTRISLPALGAEQLAMNLAMCVNGPSGCEPGTIGLRAIDVKQDGKFDIDLYKRTVRIWTRRSPNQFKEMQAREWTAERMREFFKSQVRVSEQEAFLAYSRIKSKATARSVYAQKDWFERYVVKVSDAQLDAYLASHEEAVKSAVTAMGEGWKSGCPVVSEIRIDSAQPGSDEASLAEKKAAELLAQLKAGKDFGDLARASSQADSARLSGQVGCLDDGYGTGSAVLVEAANALKKPGELSPVVETIRGFIILRLDATVSDANRTALMQRHAAYKLLLAEEAEKLALNFATQLIERAKTQSLEEATKALSYELIGTPLDTKDENRPGALLSEQAPQVSISRAVSLDQDVVPEVKIEEAATFALFQLEKEESIHEKPLAAENGYVVLQLKSREMLTEEAFAEERARVMESISKRKAELELSRQMDKLIKEAGGLTYNPKYIAPEGAKAGEKDS